MSTVLGVHEGFELPYSHALQAVPDPIYAVREHCKLRRDPWGVQIEIPESLQVRASSLATELVWAKVVRSVASSWITMLGAAGDSLDLDLCSLLAWHW